MKIAYLDDEPVCEDLLKSALISNHIYDDFDFYSNTESFINNCRQYEAVILDIQLSKSNGINLAKELHKQHPEIIVVFLTNHANMVFDAFGLNVFSFIEKTKLSEKIGACWKQLQLELAMKKKIELTAYGGHTIVVDPKSILFFETFGKKIKVYMEDGTVQTLARQSMGSLLEMLDHSLFEYANRSVIVNIQKIRSIESGYIRLAGYKDPIYASKSRYNAMQRAFIDYHSK